MWVRSGRVVPCWAAGTVPGHGYELDSPYNTETVKAAVPMWMEDTLPMGVKGFLSIWGFLWHGDSTFCCGSLQ